MNCPRGYDPCKQIGCSCHETPRFKKRPGLISTEEALEICDRARTASKEEVRAAYCRIMINAPCWAFSEDESQQRDELERAAEGPQC